MKLFFALDIFSKPKDFLKACNHETLMTLKSLLSTPAVAAAISLISLLGSCQPAAAQTCEKLDVIGGEGNEVTKTVSLPNLLFFNSNWNTDFVVGRPYRYYIVDFMSDSGSTYNIDVFLKYPDESVDASYGVRERSVPEGEAIAIRAEPRVSSDPYQVNLRVGGLNSEGNTYTASVSGCR